MSILCLKQKRMVFTFSLIGCLAAVLFHNNLAKAMTEEEHLRSMHKVHKLFYQRTLRKQVLDDIFLNKTNGSLIDGLDLATDFRKWGVRIPCQQTLIKEIKNREKDKAEQEINAVKIEIEILNNINSQDINIRTELIRSLSSENIKLKKEIKMLKEEDFSDCSCLQSLKSVFKRLWYYNW